MTVVVVVVITVVVVHDRSPFNSLHTHLVVLKRSVYPLPTPALGPWVASF